MRKSFGSKKWIVFLEGELTKSKQIKSQSDINMALRDLEDSSCSVHKR